MTTSTMGKLHNSTKMDFCELGCQCTLEALVSPKSITSAQESAVNA